MKNKNIILFSLMFFTLLSVSCKKFSDLEKDPNKASQGMPSLILTGIQSSVFNFNPILGTELRASQYLVSISSQQGNQAYTWDVTEKWGYYDVLRNVDRMSTEAANKNAPVYGILAKFFSAYCFVEMSNQLGDIPMSDALKGSSGTYAPKYDKQKDVYKACLALLEEANTEISALLKTSPNVPINGDLIYNGDAAKWQKLINSYRLRLLIALSKKEADADLNIKSQFASIVSNPAKYPLFNSNDDGAIFKWYDKEGNRYPRFYVTANMDYHRFSTTFMQYIKQYNDPRIIVIGSITAKAAAAGKSPNDITAYGGVNSGLSFSDIDAAKDDASKVNIARYSTATGEPMIVVGYPEMCFNIAEAINRGWVTGNANTYYQNGIQASMKFYGISDAAITAYLAQPAVQYTGTLNQILIQKYLAFFNNSGFESFYNQRRTGVPVLSVGPGNGNNNKIATRWSYPQTEYQYNEANIKAALQSQFSGSDDRNGVLWINQ